MQCRTAAQCPCTTRSLEIAPHALCCAGEASSSGAKRNWLLVRHYWHRVGGCALNWFVWDFAFYGNKLFQSTFISVSCWVRNKLEIAAPHQRLRLGTTVA